MLKNLSPLRVFKRSGEKIKDLIHKNEWLERTSFSIWGIWWVLKAKLTFQKIKKISSRQDVSKESKKDKIVVLALRTIPTTNLVYFDAVFGHAFRKLGCEVKMLYCDGVLSSCDANTFFRNQKPQCFVCQKFGPSIKENLGLDCISFSEFINEGEIKEIGNKVSELKDEDLVNYNYLGVNVGKYAKASAVRFFLSGEPLDLKNKKEVSVLREKLVYAMIVARVAEGVYQKERPDKIFTLHGIYSTWGPFFEYFLNQKTKVYVYCNSAARIGHFSFNLNRRDFNLIGPETWEKFKQTSLSKEEEARLDEFLTARFKGKSVELKMFEQNFNNTPRSILQRSIKDKKYSKKYLLFPNLSWDSAVDGAGVSIFQSMFIWINAMIDYFRKNPQYQLIIKPHPAELVWEKKSKNLASYIATHHPDLPENIIILEVDTPLRAYDLIGPGDVCLIYSGTLGLELATQGIPVLNAAGGHYYDAGVSYPVKNKEHFLSLLDNPQELISFAKDNINLAKRYAYYYFFKGPIRIPFYKDDKYSVMDWNILSQPHKLLSEDSNIIKVCKKIIRGEEVVGPL